MMPKITQDVNKENIVDSMSLRKTSTIVGVLFLIAFVLHTIGSTIMEEFLLSTNYLINLYANTTLVIIAEILEIIAAIAIIGIVVMTYPIIKEYNENIASKYAIFRLIEMAMLIIGVIIAFSLLSLSHEYVNAGSKNNDYFESRGALLLAGRYWTFKIVLVFVLLGYLLFFYTLYQTNQIPRFISVWGMIIVPLMFTGIILEIFVSDIYGPNTMFPGFLIFYLPGTPLDLVLGLWLIFKGFNARNVS